MVRGGVGFTRLGTVGECSTRHTFCCKDGTSENPTRPRYDKDKTRQDQTKTRQVEARQGKARQNKTKQHKIGQRNTTPDKARRDKTKQHMARRVRTFINIVA